MEHKPKDKSKFNIIIDLIMLLLMMSIAGIGFLMKYVLVPGFKRNVLYGNNVELEFLGKTHHQWGTIHLILSIALLALLLLHIILHWKMIVSISKRMIPIRIIRIVFFGLILTMGLFLIIFPLLVKPEVVEKEALYRNIQGIRLLHSDNPQVNIVENKQIYKKRNVEIRHAQINEEIEISGSQTLQFVAEKYKVPASVIAADLNIPKGLNEEKLGRLKKQYPFQMEDVRASITKYKKRNKEY